MRRLLLVGVLLLAACGGGDDDGSPADAGGRDTSPKATLGIITTEIETALGNTAFARAREGQQLDVGDRVRTDETGFAEITYHDGSWQRVEAEATLTILALTADGPVNTVRTGHDIGRTWNNVRELDDPDDTYQVRTPVGTAAVRGTTFATDCPTDDRCTFTVLDGTVRITPTTGDPVDLDAGRALTVTTDDGPGDPRPADPDDPWITANQDLDTRRNDSDDDAPTPDDGAPPGTVADACAVFSAEEATLLADQRDDGRTSGGLQRDEGSGGGGQVVSSICSWSPIDQPSQLDGDFVLVGAVELEVSRARSFDDCANIRSPMTSSGEPLPGVGDEAAWYAEDRAVIAVRANHCIVLRHDRSDAGTTGRSAFADAAQRILTRLTEPVVMGM